MPVTIRLSKLFTERLGEEIAAELVDWFNQVDATYRTDLRELNELNFARFDAKLEQRTAALEAKLEQRTAALEAKLEQRLAELEARLRTDFIERLGKLREELCDRLRDTKVSLVKWMFAFWIATALAIFGSRLAL